LAQTTLFETAVSRTAMAAAWRHPRSQRRDAASETGIHYKISG
jgi:hypothetical protein